MAMSSSNPLYSTLDPERAEIRILCLDRQLGPSECWSLETISLDDENAPEYVAVSYEWNPESLRDRATEIFRLDGYDMRLRANLSLMLRSLSESVSGLSKVWADAICIDQENTLERNRQVTMMGRIFSSAVSVHCWLPPRNDEEISTDAAGELLRKAHLELEHSEDRPGDALTSWLLQSLADCGEFKAWLGLGFIFKQSYWRRGWVVQEIYLARKLHYFCGTVVLDPGLLFLVAVALGRLNAGILQDDDPLLCTRELIIANLLSRRGVIIELLYKKREEFIQAPAQPLLDVILPHNLVYETSDPRDMIFAFLGLADKHPHYKLEVDYHATPVTIFLRAARYIIETSHRLDILALAASGGTLPSWVPNFARYSFEVKSDPRWMALSPSLTLKAGHKWSVDDGLQMTQAFVSEVTLSVRAIFVSQNLVSIPVRAANDSTQQLLDLLTGLMKAANALLPMGGNLILPMWARFFVMWVDLALLEFTHFTPEDGTWTGEELLDFCIKCLRTRTTSSGLNPRQRRWLEDSTTPIGKQFFSVNLDLSFYASVTFPIPPEFDDLFSSIEAVNEWFIQATCLPSLAVCRQIEEFEAEDTLAVIPGCASALILRPASPESDTPRKWKIISEAYVYGLARPEILAQLPMEEIHLV